MALNCYFQYENGRFCKKFAMTGSRFCNNHQPPPALDPAAIPRRDAPGSPVASQVHPHLRLASPSDLFDLVRETLHATRTGALTPSQAFAISSLCTVWLRVYEGMRAHQRLTALQQQILPSLVSAEAAAAAEHEARLKQDAIFRADTEPAPLDRRNPWAAGLMAGPAPDAQSPDDGEGHGFIRAAEDGQPGPSLLPQTYAESPGAQREPSHQPRNGAPQKSAPRQPVSLREAQAKLEAMLAEQAAGKAGKVPPKPNGGSP